MRNEHKANHRIYEYVQCTTQRSTAASVHITARTKRCWQTAHLSIQWHRNVAATKANFLSFFLLLKKKTKRNGCGFRLHKAHNGNND